MKERGWNLKTHRKLCNTLKITPPTPFAEQDSLNKYFRYVYKPIPHAYNLVHAMLWHYPENVVLGRVKVVHYCAAGSKPWRHTGSEENMDRDDVEMLVRRWLDIFDDESLDYESVAAAEEAAKQEMLERIFAAQSEEGGEQCVTGAPAA